VFTIISRLDSRDEWHKRSAFDDARMLSKPSINDETNDVHDSGTHTGIDDDGDRRNTQTMAVLPLNRRSRQ
jgi:hypothetical protein